MHRGGIRGGGRHGNSSRGNRGGSRGGRGGGGRGGGHPSGLSGRDIGMFYARRGKAKREKLDVSNRSVVTLNRDHEREIESLLQEEKIAGMEDHNESTTSSDIVALNIKSEPSTPEEKTKPSILHELSRDSSLDKKFLLDLDKKENEQKYQDMLDFRKKLPSYKKRKEILDLVSSNQVLVISGETGCGKTTQVAQFILDDCIRNNDGSTCHIICTQPRRISAISVAERVAAERNERIGNSAGFQIRLESKMPRAKGSILYCTTGILLRRLVSDPFASCASHLILDEIHERDIMSDFLMVIIKDLLPKRPDLKVILMSATLNAEMFSNYYNGCPMLHIPGYTFAVREIYLEEIIENTGYRGNVKQNKPFAGRMFHGEKKRLKLEEEGRFHQYLDTLENKYSYNTRVSLSDIDFETIDYNIVMTVINEICTKLGDGAILIFMPGWEQISKLHDLLTKNPVYGSNKFIVIPLHSMMPTTNQREVFERPPVGTRKIIIATSIAETSITIDDIVFVIDSGKSKEKTYDIENNISCLQLAWVTKASAKQRKGRAGRVQAGYCFHLYTQYHYDQLNEYQLPEMLRTPLDSLCLQIKILRLGNIDWFLHKAMQPPDKKAIENAIFSLTQMRALDEKENLTALGYHLAKLPVVPKVGRMILFGAIFSCLDPVLTVAASLDFKEPFYIPIHKEKQADAMKIELSKDSKSDHIMLINAFKGWEEARDNGCSGEYCWRNFLSVKTLKMIENMKKQFSQLLHDIGFTKSSNTKDRSSNINSDNVNLIKAVICAGLYPHVAKIVYTNEHGKRPPKIELISFGKAAIHPKSVNSDVIQYETQWLIYHEKMKTTKLYLYDCTMISPLPLLFFGGKIKVHQANGMDTIEIDDGIKFHSPLKYATLVKDLRKELDHLLQKKIKNPSMELIAGQAEESRDTKILNAIIDLITTEKVKTKAHSGYK